MGLKKHEDFSGLMKPDQDMSRQLKSGSLLKEHERLKANPRRWQSCCNLAAP
jgi:hypothetical protein